MNQGGREQSGVGFITYISIISRNSRSSLSQFVGKFRTEHSRQDLSTGYYLRVKDNQKIVINQDHFSAYQIVTSAPNNMGAMYKFYLKIYQELRLKT